MRALRLHGPEDLRLDDVPEPELRPGTVKIKVEWCGICGSDLHLYQAGPAAFGLDAPHPITGEGAPVIMGHEFAGRITEVGAGVTGLAVGDAVCVEPELYDDTCAYCRRGDYNLCLQSGFVGINGWGGGLSEYAVLPRRMVHRLPDGIGTDVGALVEPLAVAWHAVRRAELPPGATALVVGAGPIGLGVLSALGATGARLVAVSEPSTARRELAARLGADTVLDPTRDDVPARVRDLMDGLGADVAFDASGLQVTLDTALGSLRKRGTAVNLAVWEQPAQIAPTQLMLTETSLTSTIGYSGADFPAVIAALRRGVLDAAPFITTRIPLERAIQDGYEALLGAGREEQVKVLVHP
ncbi:2,3-butanediol dehydrogenase [Streptomyces cavernicola]|uniref:2,3-butanediol dehydrogenase n=1 Tax=Streptomyces cavernicola TaxID=3043613 RepID=A0ABT6SB00_9ACTN|nr:2,3-butanediol dehydrogenase [Streptomyces sp. B-S-A6]MDI3405120.1 2,3-butanediol dehydrogenase [Streptomyces sp. B-S-A6]